MRKADAVENPDSTGSDKKVAIAPMPKMRMIMCQKPTQSVNAIVTWTWSRPYYMLFRVSYFFTLMLKEGQRTEKREERRENERRENERRREGEEEHRDPVP